MVRAGLIIGLVLLLAGCGETQESAQKPQAVGYGCGTSSPLRAPLLRPYDLDTLRASNEVVVIDVRPDSLYHKGHIEGAVQIWRPDYASSAYPYGGMAPSREEMADLLDSLGVTQTAHVVAYDGKNGCDAARVWWLLKRYGHAQSWVLEASAERYAERRGRTLEQGLLPAPKRTGFAFSEAEDPSWVIDLDSLQVLLADTNTLLLDTRSHEEFLGSFTKNGAARPGHIPGAVWWDWNNALTSKTSASICPTSVITVPLEDVLLRDLESYDRIVVYCHSGVRSAHTTMVFRELAGLTNVTNYDGSWVEWSHHAALPAQTTEP